MLKNIKSSNISVFPSKRHVNNHISLEESFLNIIYQLVDVDSFVITKNFNPKESFDFNIHGYYFSVNPASDITRPFTGATDLFAYIRTPFKSLNVDSEEYYKGLTISNALPTDADSDNVFGLRILHRKDIHSDWTVPAEAKVKFGFSSLADDRAPMKPEK